MIVSPYIIDTLNFGSFPGKILFTVGYSFEEIAAELKKQKCPEWLDALNQTKNLFTEKNNGFAAARTYLYKGEEYFYYFLHLKNKFDFSDKAHTTLAHEAIHICTFNLSDMLNIVTENEAFAYTHSHILNQCYTLLRRKKGTKK